MMGLFARKERDEAEPENEAKEQYRRQQEELNELRQKVEMVKEEYGSTVADLMGVKRELNQKKMELDTASRELAKVSEKTRRTAELADSASIGKFNKTAEGLLAAREQLKKTTIEHQRIKKELESGQAELRNIRKQSTEYKKELDEASARLYNAKEELAKKPKFQDTGALSIKEKETIQVSGQSQGVIEAASAVVGSLKSKLAMAQKELDAVQGLLEKERTEHAETRRKLERL